MDKAVKLGDVRDLLDQLDIHWKNVEAENGNLSSVERDLLKDKIKQLYDFIENYEHEVVEAVVDTEKSSEISENENHEVDAESNLVETHLEKEKIESSVQENIEIEDLGNNETDSAVSDLQDESIPISENEISVQEKIAEELVTSEDLATKLQNNSIPDLTKAISLNQRFEFTNELFDGNGGDYEVALNDLNSQPELNGAIEVLNSLKERFEWNEENGVVKELHKLVERRYS